ncbi:MAG: 30S ribosomal protein S20 [Desulfatitalea sp.]|nr:30S ribosomal protein S20 [Desulfatitalea sp.]NNK02828.1 30S ribosomal protein S20 [Desulfatitalea sp.]
MANHKSALKRAGQNQIRRLRNRKVKTRVKNMVKQVRQAATDGSAEQTLSSLASAQSVIDKAAKRGVLHKRTAARKVARLAKLTQTVQS